MKVLKSYPNTHEGQKEVLAFKQGWEAAYNRHVGDCEYERVEIEFSRVNVNVVLYRGLLREDGSVVWEDESKSVVPA